MGEYWTSGVLFSITIREGSRKIDTLHDSINFLELEFSDIMYCHASSRCALHYTNGLVRDSLLEYCVRLAHTCIHIQHV